MLRETTVVAPSWKEGTTRVREPRVRDFLAARKIEDEEERTITLLGSMVLDDDGQPVGKEAILDASHKALDELGAVIPELLSKDGAKSDVPLDPPTA